MGVISTAIENVMGWSHKKYVTLMVKHGGGRDPAWRMITLLRLARFVFAVNDKELCSMLKGTWV
jgi:hypothetical protein